MRHEELRTRRLAAAIAAVMAFLAVGNANAAWGDPDYTFGTLGVYYDTTKKSYPAAVAVQPDGKIVVAGYTKVLWGTTMRKRVMLRRYLKNGGLDPAFGSRGIGSGSGNILLVGNADYEANRIVILPNGQIVVSVIGNGKQMIWTYYSSGSIRSTKTIEGNRLGELVNIGNVVYSTQSRGQNDLCVIRLNSDGSKDDSFGGSGCSLTVFDASKSSSILAEPDTGKLTVAGFVANGGVTVDRKNSDGSNDSTLNSWWPYMPHYESEISHSIENVFRLQDGTYAVVLQGVIPTYYTYLNFHCFVRFNSEGHHTGISGGNMEFLFGAVQNNAGGIATDIRYSYRYHAPDLSTSEIKFSYELPGGPWYDLTHRLIAWTPDDRLLIVGRDEPEDRLAFMRLKGE